MKVFRMKANPVKALFFVTTLVVSSAWAQSSGPDARQLTDPNSVVSLVSPISAPIPYDDLYFTRTVGEVSWSPDGKEILFTTDLAGRPNIWKMNSNGAWPVQLVQSDESQYAGAWSPDGKWIVYEQDFGGNGTPDLFAVPSAGGQPVNLTNTPDIKEAAPLWSPDGKSIAMIYKAKEGHSNDVAILDWATRKVHNLTSEESLTHYWEPIAWSKNSRTLYANRKEISHADADVYAIDVASGKVSNLTAHDGKSLNLASSLSADGKKLLITSNAKSGFKNVAILDIVSKKITWITDTKWEAEAGHFSPDGKNLSYTINSDGLTETYIADTTSLKGRRIDLALGMNMPVANPNSFSPDGNRLLLSHESSLQPADLWIYDIKSHKSKQITQSSIASLSATAMPPMQVVHYKTFDGKTISALLWVPFNLKRDGTNPAIVLPHGGPAGQVQGSWNPDVAALVSRGYICIAPNVRGSTGYGMAFQMANVNDLGGGDLQDEVYAVQFLEATGYVDSRKLGIKGGSYGGYLTLMAIGRNPEIWAAAVEEYGMIDWATMFENSDPMLKQVIKSLLGDPVENAKIYTAASPATYIHHAKAPLLILQGENDTAVPKEEAVQVEEILKKDGKTVEAHYYPNEGHGFSKREDQIDSIRRSVDWFDTYLKDKKSVTLNQN
jgi:dipeptidyl aminopeptidase/acylaminoacyl peptidase